MPSHSSFQRKSNGNGPRQQHTLFTENDVVVVQARLANPGSKGPALLELPSLSGVFVLGFFPEVCDFSGVGGSIGALLSGLSILSGLKPVAHGVRMRFFVSFVPNFLWSFSDSSISFPSTIPFAFFAPASKRALAIGSDRISNLFQ